VDCPPKPALCYQTILSDHLVYNAIPHVCIAVKPKKIFISLLKAWCRRPHMELSILSGPVSFVAIPRQFQSILHASQAFAWPPPAQHQPTQLQCCLKLRHRWIIVPESGSTKPRSWWSQGVWRRKAALAQTSYCWNRRSSGLTSDKRRRIIWEGGRSSRRKVDWGSMYKRRRGRWRWERRSSGWRGAEASYVID